MTANESRTQEPAVPWRRLITEGVVIVLSILLAFAIDAGWDEFKESIQEQAFLESLLSDFQEARARIDESVSRHEGFINQARQLLDYRASDAPDWEGDSLEAALGAVFFDWSSLYFPSGSRDALFASGDIEIVSNDELRAMLAGWPSRVADAAEDEIWIANDVMYNTAPYLHRKIRTRNVSRLTSPNAAPHIPALASVDHDALWDDPMFDNLVAYRILNETYAIREIHSLGDTIDEIVRTIESELGR